MSDTRDHVFKNGWRTNTNRGPHGTRAAYWQTGNPDPLEYYTHYHPDRLLRAGRSTFEGNSYGRGPAITPMDYVDERYWIEDAACTDKMDLFERSAEVRITARVVQEAMAVCADCPVRQACLADAMESESGSFQHRWGIRGGLTARQRGDLWEAEQQG